MAAPGNLYPNVHMVDTNATYPPPLPPKPVPFPKRRSRSGSQPLLYTLVALALCGMAVEACFIYSLYMKSTEDTPEASHQVADKPTPRVMPEEVGPAKPEEVGPAKPLAHLTGSGNKPAANGHMFWTEVDGDSEVHGFKYKDGNLTVQLEGYYFVYSKIYFNEKPSVSVLHSVVRVTKRYPREMVLLQSREYHPKVVKEDHSPRTNSYLGGMFHLLAGDVIFVRVNKTDVILSTSAENYFGAYMV